MVKILLAVLIRQIIIQSAIHIYSNHSATLMCVILVCTRFTNPHDRG